MNLKKIICLSLLGLSLQGNVFGMETPINARGYHFSPIAGTEQFAIKKDQYFFVDHNGKVAVYEGILNQKKELILENKYLTDISSNASTLDLNSNPLTLTSDLSSEELKIFDTPQILGALRKNLLPGTSVITLQDILDNVEGPIPTSIQFTKIPVGFQTTKGKSVTAGQPLDLWADFPLGFSKDVVGDLEAAYKVSVGKKVSSVGTITLAAQVQQEQLQIQQQLQEEPQQQLQEQSQQQLQEQPQSLHAEHQALRSTTTVTSAAALANFFEDPTNTNTPAQNAAILINNASTAVIRLNTLNLLSHKNAALILKNLTDAQASAILTASATASGKINAATGAPTSADLAVFFNNTIDYLTPEKIASIMSSLSAITELNILNQPVTKISAANVAKILNKMTDAQAAALLTAVPTAVTSGQFSATAVAPTVATLAAFFHANISNLPASKIASILNSGTTFSAATQLDILNQPITVISATNVAKILNAMADAKAGAILSATPTALGSGQFSTTAAAPGTTAANKILVAAFFNDNIATLPASKIASILRSTNSTGTACFSATTQLEILNQTTASITAANVAKILNAMTDAQAGDMLSATPVALASGQFSITAAAPGTTAANKILVAAFFNDNIATLPASKIATILTCGAFTPAQQLDILNQTIGSITAANVAAILNAMTAAQVGAIFTATPTSLASGQFASSNTSSPVGSAANKVLLAAFFNANIATLPASKIAAIMTSGAFTVNQQLDILNQTTSSITAANVAAILNAMTAAQVGAILTATPTSLDSGQFANGSTSSPVGSAANKILLAAFFNTNIATLPASKIAAIMTSGAFTVNQQLDILNQTTSNITAANVAAILNSMTDAQAGAILSATPTALASGQFSITAAVPGTTDANKILLAAFFNTNIATLPASKIASILTSGFFTPSRQLDILNQIIGNISAANVSSILNSMTDAQAGAVLTAVPALLAAGTAQFSATADAPGTTILNKALLAAFFNANTATLPLTKVASILTSGAFTVNQQLDLLNQVVGTITAANVAGILNAMTDTQVGAILTATPTSLANGQFAESNTSSPVGSAANRTLVSAFFNANIITMRASKVASVLTSGALTASNQVDILSQLVATMTAANASAIVGHMSDAQINTVLNANASTTGTALVTTVGSEAGSLNGATGVGAPTKTNIGSFLSNAIVYGKIPAAKVATILNTFSAADQVTIIAGMQAIQKSEVLAKMTSAQIKALGYTWATLAGILDTAVPETAAAILTSGAFTLSEQLAILNNNTTAAVACTIIDAMANISALNVGQMLLSTPTSSAGTKITAANTKATTSDLGTFLTNLMTVSTASKAASILTSGAFTLKQQLDILNVSTTTVANAASILAAMTQTQIYNILTSPKTSNASGIITTAATAYPPALTGATTSLGAVFFTSAIADVTSLVKILTSFPVPDQMRILDGLGWATNSSLNAKLILRGMNATQLQALLNGSVPLGLTKTVLPGGVMSFVATANTVSTSSSADKAFTTHLAVTSDVAGSVLVNLATGEARIAFQKMFPPYFF